MSPILTLGVRSLEPEINAIDVQGEVTASAAETLADAFARASADKTRFIVLNFSGLEYMNSSGIGLLVTLLIRANRHDPPQRLAAVGLSEHYRHIFELTRLNEAIRLYPTQAEALRVAAGS